MKKIKKSLHRNLLLFIALVTLSVLCPADLRTQVYAADIPVNVTLEVAHGGAAYDVVSGTVTGVEPDSVWVVVFARTNQWYIQPYEDERAYLMVNEDGTYETWVRDWHQISAFVIQKGYNAISAQQVYKPFPLSLDSMDILAIAAYPSIQFSGYEWAIKAGDYLGPGPNYFSSNQENVWVDDQGRLHLKVTRRDEKWYCAEIYLMQPLGFGNYTFQLSSRIDQLDKNVIGSPFIYQDDTHELDVEFSKWGVEDGPNAQFVVQPYYNFGNQEQFCISLLNDNSTHIIKWKSDIASFKSAQGHNLNPAVEQIIHQWKYIDGDVPTESDELVHINLWLLNGQAPSDATETEMIIQDFTFYTNYCTPPPSGDWIITEKCALLTSDTVNGNVYIEDNASLTIERDAMLSFE